MESLRIALLDSGHRVSRVAITKSGAVDLPDTYYPDGPISVLRRVRSLNADVLHLHVGGDLNSRLEAMIIALSLLGAPVVMTLHSGGFPSSEKALRARPRSITGIALRRLKAFIGVNSEIAASAIPFGVMADKCLVIKPHSKVQPHDVANDIPAHLTKFYLAHDPVLISVGGLELEYGLHLQIEAMPLVRQTYPQAGLVLVGSGSLRVDLQNRVAESSLQDHVAIVGDLPRAQTLRAISEATMMLRTTSYDGDAMSIREALQLGTEVLASKTALRPAGVKLLNELSVDALSRQICDLLSLQCNTQTDSTVETPDEMQIIISLYGAVSSKSNRKRSLDKSMGM